MPIAAFVPAIIGGATSVIGGLMGSKSAKNAGNTVQAAGDKAAQGVTDATKVGQEGIAGASTSAQDLLKQAYGDAKGAYGSYAGAGEEGIRQLIAALSPGGALAEKFAAPTADDAAATPGYQFTKDQGIQAGLRAASAAGSLGSGGTQKALAQYSTGLASTYYQQAYNNALKTFQTNHDNTASGIAQLTGLGQFGATGLAGAAENFGNSSASNLMQSAISSASLGEQGAIAAGNFGFQGAQGKAAGDVGSTNSWLNALKGVGQAGSNAAQVWNGQTNDGSSMSKLNFDPYEASGASKTLASVPLSPPSILKPPNVVDGRTLSRNVNGDWNY